MKFKIGIKPNEIIFIICSIIILTFSYILINFDGSIYKERYQIEESNNQFEYVIVNYYPTYKDEIYKRYIDNNHNIHNSINRVIYSPHSPLYHTFSFRSNILIGILCIELLLATILFFIFTEKLSKCNYQLKNNFTTSSTTSTTSIDTSSNNNNNNNEKQQQVVQNQDEEDEELETINREKRILLKKKRNVALGVVLFLFVLLTILSIIYTTWLPLNIRKTFIHQQYYNREIDPLCTDTSIDSDNHIGKCRSLSGTIHPTSGKYKFYSWSLENSFTSTYVVLISTGFIGFFLASLIFVIKCKKDPNEVPITRENLTINQIPPSFMTY